VSTVASRVLLEEESLEQMALAIEARQAAEEEDEEADLDELIRELADIRVEPFVDEEFMREDEFACRSCGMILHRSLLANRRRLVCIDCA
jgi:hemerythrin